MIKPLIDLTHREARVEIINLNAKIEILQERIAEAREETPVNNRSVAKLGESKAKKEERLAAIHELIGPDDNEAESEKRILETREYTTELTIRLNGQLIARSESVTDIKSNRYAAAIESLGWNAQHEAVIWLNR